MLFILLLILSPLIGYLVLIGVLILRRKTDGVLVSGACAVVAMTAMSGAILRSGVPDAQVGLAGVPVLGALAGLVGLLFGRWRSSPDPLRKGISWVLFAIVLLYVLSVVRQGFGARDAHSVRNTESPLFSFQLARDRNTITAELRKHWSTQGAYLDSALRSQINDRAFVMAALERDSLSPGLIDTLARRSDSTIVLRAAKNPNAWPETLARIYRTHPASLYYITALAGNHHTPPDVLKEIAATTRDPWVIRSMLLNKALDCGLLNRLATTLYTKPGDTSDVVRYDRLVVKELAPKTCPEG